MNIRESEYYANIRAVFIIAFVGAIGFWFGTGFVGLWCLAAKVILQWVTA